MKRNYKINLAVSLFFLCSFKNILAQIQNKNDVFNCLSPKEIAEHKASMKAARTAYFAEHNISETKLRKAATHVMLSWPMLSVSDYDFNPNNFKITNFVDQDTTDNNVDTDERNPLFIEDYNCGKRTYDGHDAEDISLYPYAWTMFDNSSVMAIAAAPGVILGPSDDGNFDKNCQWAGAGNANHVSILHDDGTVTNYWHLKLGTVTTKTNGMRVNEGEYLGFIGSSGRSTGPHLHFSVYDINDILIDPFTGNCNLLNNDSWWNVQRPYTEPMINRMMTHSAIPVMGNCYSTFGSKYDIDALYAKNEFNSGDIFFTGTYFKDVTAGDVAVGEIFTPSGASLSTWTLNFSNSHNTYESISNFQLPNGNSGTYTFKMTYKGKNYYHFFSVNCPNSASISGVESGSQGYITSNYITSTASHNTNSQSKILYQAPDHITFSPGFEVKAGAHLKARIKSCDFVE